MRNVLKRKKNHVSDFHFSNFIQLSTNIQNSWFKWHYKKFTIVTFFDFITCVVIPQRTSLFEKEVEQSSKSFEPIGQTEETQTAEDSFDNFEPIQGSQQNLVKTPRNWAVCCSANFIVDCCLHEIVNVCTKVQDDINYWMTIGAWAFLFYMIHTAVCFTW